MKNILILKFKIVSLNVPVLADLNVEVPELFDYAFANDHVVSIIINHAIIGFRH